MQTTPNFLDMSDDDIQNMSAPPVGTDIPAEKVVEEPPAQTPEEIAAEAAQREADQKAQDDAAALEAAKPDDQKVETPVLADDPNLTAPDDKQLETPKSVKKADEVKTPDQIDEEKAAAQKVIDDAAAVAKPPETVVPVLSMEEKAAALDGLMTFKANGKEVKLNSVAEALQLQQMGANYTKKMQQLQPSLRLIKMLDNNKLTDPNELAYLIDLHQRKPEAIQRLLADSKFDPMTVDVEKAAEYTPGPHQVSDIEVQFQTVLDEVEASETGPELLAEVTRQWDEGSRRALFQHPQLLSELNSQKAMGLYGKITTEMERRKMLGGLQNVPFLEAYENVGKELYANGALKFPDQETPNSNPVTEPLKPVPVATRVVTPPAKVLNGDKAAAASAPKGTDTPVKIDPDYLSMPDSDFLKQFEGRL